ncbi:MAG: hypothetical protein LBL46_00320 [Rickettsiales bacterium]|jgi:hypothetical protein|nr:hypothetical protein [Rickettsiales bacterium]
MSFIQETFMAANFWTALSAVATLIASVVALWVAFHEKPSFKIKNVIKNGNDFVFDIQNLASIPLEIKGMFSEPDVFHKGKNWQWTNTEIDFTLYMPETLHSRMWDLARENSQELSRASNQSKIMPYCYARCSINAFIAKRDVKGWANNNKIGVLKAKKIVILTNIGEIFIKIPR